jgi:tetratricopeptide (TPR) repeat protein
MNDWLNAERHAERAHQLFEQGQWHEALAELQCALAVNPEQAEWKFGMAVTLDALQRYEEAIACYRQVLDLRGEDVETLQLLAMDCLRTDQPRAAADALERLSRLDPQHEPAYCYRILAHARLGEHDLAEQMFYTARQIVEECPTCFDHIAHSLLARGQADRAIWCWQQTRRLDEAYPDVCRFLARAHWHKGQRERAHQFYLEQLREDPGDVDTLLELGNLQLEMGRLADASEKYRRVLELDPADAQAHLQLGRVALLSNHLDAAQAELELASRLEPTRVGVHLALAQVAQRRQQRDLALRHLDAEMKLTGHSPLLTLELAEALVDLDVPQTALPMLTAMIDDAPCNGMDAVQLAGAYHCRAVAKFRMGRWARGIVDSRLALRLHPRHVEAMQNLVVAYMRGESFPRAHYWLCRALELSPKDATLHQLRKRLFVARLLSKLPLRKRGRNARRGR